MKWPSHMFVCVRVPCVRDVATAWHVPCLIPVRSKLFPPCLWTQAGAVIAVQRYTDRQNSHNCSGACVPMP